MKLSPLEKKKLEVELSQVRVGRESMELKIMEREEEIERIREQIEISSKREQGITIKLAESTGE